MKNLSRDLRDNEVNLRQEFEQCGDVVFRNLKCHDARFGMSWAQMHSLAPMNTKKEWSVFVCVMVLVAAVGTSLILDLDIR